MKKQLVGSRWFVEQWLQFDGDIQNYIGQILHNFKFIQTIQAKSPAKQLEVLEALFSSDLGKLFYTLNDLQYFNKDDTGI